MTTISSTFDSDLDGWTMDGDVASFVWEPTGGNPGGFAHWVDAATGALSYYVAPSKFLGDQSAYYGGTLSYDIEDTGNDIDGLSDIELTGDGMTLVYVTGQPATTWTHFSATLTAASGWFVGSHAAAVSGDPAATETQLQEVLANLTSIEIRAEYVNGDENGGLDNVVMTSVATTSVWDLWTSPAKTSLIGAYTTFAAALAAAKTGDDIAFEHNGAGGGAIGVHFIGVNDLTIEADTSVTGSFSLGVHTTTFSLGGTANFSVAGTAGADTITGNDGANVIRTKGGADTVHAGIGNDLIYLSSTPTLIDGGAGTDTVYVTAGVVALTNSNVTAVEKFSVAGGATLNFSGSSLGRVITSHSTASTAATILGSTGADIIYAGAGADSITGGAGRDLLFAGSGADTFHYDVSGFGQDLIRNVNLAKDVFDVHALGSSMADLHFTTVTGSAGGAKITGTGDTNAGDSILLVGVTVAAAQMTGHFTF